MNNWADTLESGIYQAGGILGARYAVPQLSPGQYYSTTPQGGMVTYQNPPGASSFGTPMPSERTSLLLYGGLALLAFMLMGRGR